MKKRIEEATQNLLLEAARKMDEIREALPVSDRPASVEDELRLKQKKGEDLQNVFSNLAEEMIQEAELPALEKMLASGEKAGADLLFLRMGHSPSLLRGNRIVGRLPGLVSEADMDRFETSIGKKTGVATKHDFWQFLDGGEAGSRFAAFRRCGRTPSLEEINLIPDRVDALFNRPAGIVLLVAETPAARSLLMEGVLGYLGSRGELVVAFGKCGGSDEKGLFLRTAPGPEAHSLIRSIDALPSARIGFASLRSRKETLQAVDLARRGHLVTVAVPGREPGDAIRRILPWLREEGRIESLSALFRGTISMQLHAGGENRLLPVTSLAIWNEAASEALGREDFTGLSRVLDQTAGDDSFARSLTRLVSKRLIEKSEADRIASLIPLPVPVATRSAL